MAFVVVFAVDLLTKTIAVSHGGLGLVAWNDTHAGDFERRVIMSLAAVAFVFVAAVVARRRGIGRLWGAWIGVGLLVGGVLANGVSQFIWSRGVPDFIHFYSLSSRRLGRRGLRHLVGPRRRRRLDRGGRADRVRPRPPGRATARRAWLTRA